MDLPDYSCNAVPGKECAGCMGIYLNGKRAYSLFQEDCAMTYYIDKTEMLDEIVRILEQKGNAVEETGAFRGKKMKYLCVTRPRRFGKTMAANMIGAFFGKGADSSEEFVHLKAAGYGWYQKHLNQHNVIHIMFNELPENRRSYEQYISRIKKGLIGDLRMAYPEIEIEKEDSVWDALTKVFEYGNGDKFIFVLDEWDYIYHQKFVTEEEKDDFTKFLKQPFEG